MTIEFEEKTSVWYILFRAVDQFFEKHNRLPGQCDQEVETDVSLLKVREMIKKSQKQ